MSNNANTDNDVTEGDVSSVASSTTITDNAKSTKGVVLSLFSDNATQGTNASVSVGRVNFNHKGTWDNTNSYIVLDVVQYNNTSYVCKQDNTGVDITNSDYWEISLSIDYSNTDFIGGF